MSDPGARRVPDPKAAAPTKLEFTKAELQAIKDESERQNYTLKFPALIGGATAAYYLQLNGRWKKGVSPIPALAYLPKCFVTGFVAYAVASMYGTKKIYAKLKEMDGNFSRSMRGEPLLPVDTDTLDDGNYTSQKSAADTGGMMSDFNVHVQDQNVIRSMVQQPADKDDPTAQQSITYADLRKRSRSHDDPTKRPNQPPRPLFPQPPTSPQSTNPSPPPPLQPSPSPSPNRGGTNKYGDTWS